MQNWFHELLMNYKALSLNLHSLIYLFEFIFKYIPIYTRIFAYTVSICARVMCPFTPQANEFEKYCSKSVLNSLPLSLLRNIWCVLWLADHLIRSPSPFVAWGQIWFLHKWQDFCTYYWWRGLSCSRHPEDQQIFPFLENYSRARRGRGWVFFVFCFFFVTDLDGNSFYPPSFLSMAYKCNCSSISQASWGWNLIQFCLLANFPFSC